MQSQFALPSSFAILTNGRSSYGKVFPVSIAEKLQRGSSLLESSQPKSTPYKDKRILLEIDFQTLVFRYPNMCLSISNHVCLELFFTGYQRASM